MTLTIKGLPESTGELLRSRAAAQGRSLNREIVRILVAAGEVEQRRREMRASRRRADLEILSAGAFPFNPAWKRSMPERAAQRALDLITRLNWRVAGRRTPSDGSSTSRRDRDGAPG